MKKKTMLTAASIAVIFTLTGCGANPSSGNSVDAKRINALETEVKGLKEELSKIQDRIDMDSGKYADQGSDGSGSGSQAANMQDSWTDDTVIAFTDEQMLDYVREITGVMERDITYGDVKNITVFPAIGGFSDITPLKYFTSAVRIDTGTDYNTDLSALANLTNLEELSMISCDKLTDISALSNLVNLQELAIGAENLTDISAISNLANLQRLDISYCEKLTDISALGNLANLQKLRIDGCKKLTDISALSNLANLQELSIGDCDELTDISTLSNFAGIQSVYLRDCENLTDVSVLEQLTGVQYSITGCGCADMSNENDDYEEDEEYE